MNNSKNKEKSFERFLVIAAAIVFLLSSYIVLDESLFNRLFGEKNEGQPIAKIVSAKKDVRRRNSQQMAWYSMRKNSDIYQEDLIFAGNDSEAIVEFNDGNKLKVDPNTLITLKESEGSIELALKYGAFKGQIEKDKTLQIVINGEKQVIKGSENSEIVIKKGQNGAEIEVLKGEVNVDEKVITKNQTIEIDNKGKTTEPTEVNLALISPKYGSSFWNVSKKEIPLSWTKIKGRDYEVIVASDPDFKKVVLRKKVKNSEQTKVLLNTTGVYYWRIYSTSRDVKSSSPTWNFSFNLESAPELVYPPAQATFKVSAERDAEKNTFSWDEKVMTFVFNHSPQASQYIVQISENDEFTTNVIQKSTDSLRLDELNLPHGKYFWRVKVNSPQRPLALWSPIGEFSILHSEEELETPKLLLAQALRYNIPNLNYPNWLYDSADEIISDYLFTELPKRNYILPLLNYSEVFAASTYEFEIFKNGSRLPSITSFDKPRFQFKGIHPGNFQIRMRAKNKSTLPSEWTNFSSIQVTVFPPNSRTAISFNGVTSELERTPQKVDLLWTKRLFARGYEVQLSTNRQFQNIRSFTQPENTRSIEILPNQDYFWRVRALSSDSLPISKFSTVYQLRFNQEYEPPAPILAKYEEIPDVEIETKIQEEPQSDSELGAAGLLAKNRARRFFEWEVERRDPAKKPNYWAWGGTGVNYQSIGSTAGTQTVDVDQLGGPTAYINLGASSEVWGANFSFRNRPGNIQTSTGATISPSSFSWKTFALEGLYAFKSVLRLFGLNTESRLRAGVQRHSLPLVSENGTNTLELLNATLNSASLGADFTLGREQRLRYELFMRYQYPLTASVDSDESFTISPQFAFDGSVGLVYRLTPTSYFGLHWGAQYQKYSFSKQDGSSAEGDQSLFFSNVDTQLGFEF